MSIQPIAGVSHRPDALTGNASRPVSFGYAEAPFPDRPFAQALINIGAIIFGALFISVCGVAVAAPVLIALLCLPVRLGLGITVAVAVMASGILYFYPESVAVGLPASLGAPRHPVSLAANEQQQVDLRDF